MNCGNTDVWSTWATESGPPETKGVQLLQLVVMILFRTMTFLTHTREYEVKPEASLPKNSSSDLHTLPTHCVQLCSM